MAKKILVGYGVDVDAVANWLDTKTGAPVDQGNVSRGVFGATVGVDRLLKLFKKYDIKASWYVPAHSLESFPKQMAKVRDAGHEIGLHGYTHEHVSGLSEQQENDVLQKSMQVLSDFIGKKVRGWTCPAWTPSRATVRLLEEHGIEYDHSHMHHDSQMYLVPYAPEICKETDYKSLAAGDWMTPMSMLKPSSIVCVPANWHLDDWPAFQPKPALGSAGFVDPHQIEQFWKEQFEFCLREYDSFVFPISIHPQVSGKPQVLMMHERLIEWINTHQGVEWCTFEEMADQFKSGQMPGVSVEGGAEI